MATMTSELLASGKIISQKDGVVVFNPAGTNYELYLKSPMYDGKLNVPVKATIKTVARKIWTVPSGGNFIAPILGTPRTIQGRVRALDQQSMVVQAGTNIVVEFPSDDSAFDLANGGISVGSLVNVVAQPGARIEIKSS
jgi:hypothetical protein